MKRMPFLAYGALLIGICFASVPCPANAGSLQSYAADEYYLGAGGTPPGLKDFAANPRAYLRSEVAYQSLKQGFSDKLGRDLSDAEFQDLLAGDQVRLVPCGGTISTSGISAVGAVGWSVRDCYGNEYLIELLVDQEWVKVASQGCFNLTRPYRPTYSKRPPTSKSAPPTSRTIVIPQSPTVLWLEGAHVPLPNCCENCGHNHIKLPDTYLRIDRGSITIKEFSTPQRMN